MALIWKERVMLRTLVNRANAGPPWFADSLGNPLLNALHAELRYQTRAWLSTQIARELQQMLPPSERVTYTPSTELQAPARNCATESAVPVTRGQTQRLENESAQSQVPMTLVELEWWPELNKGLVPVPSPAQAGIEWRNLLGREAPPPEGWPEP